MKVFRINQGYCFKHPHESAYAFARRLLSVNPGIPLSVIRTNARHARSQGLNNSEHDTTYDAGLSVALSKTFSSHNRHCPVCAQAMYHCHLFEMDWLTHCPIHHAPLITICPGCHQPWPSPQEIASRECRVCGLMSLKDMATHVLPAIKQTSYEPITTLYEWLSKSEKDRDALLATYHPYVWYLRIESGWERMMKYHVQYPAAQQLLYPTLTPAQLNASHVKLDDVHLRIADLEPVTVIIKDRYTCRWLRSANNLPVIDLDPILTCNEVENGENRPPDINHKFRQYLTKWEFPVFCDVLAWIAKYSPPDHRLHLVNLRNKNMYHIGLDTGVCPYCLAFCLWLQEVVEQSPGLRLEPYSLEYPFLQEFYIPSTASPALPVLSVNRNRYHTDISFTKWFYKRSLETSFIQKMKIAFIFHERLQLIRKDVRDGWNKFSRIDEKYLYDQKCLYECRDNRLYFCYEHEHPFDHYNPSSITEVMSTYKWYHQNTNLIPWHDPIDIDPSEEYNYERYLTLVDAYRMPYNNQDLYSALDRYVTAYNRGVLNFNSI